jgi:hypothetical protein
VLALAGSADGRSRSDSAQDQEVTGLYAGIDTHKDTLAIAVIDHHGRLLASQEVANTERGFTELTQLLEAHRVVRVGIEGSGAFGRAVAVHLALTWSPEDCNDSPAGPDHHLELGTP